MLWSKKGKNKIDWWTAGLFYKLCAQYWQIISVFLHLYDIEVVEKRIFMERSCSSWGCRQEWPLLVHLQGLPGGSGLDQEQPGDLHWPGLQGEGGSGLAAGREHLPAAPADRAGGPLCSGLDGDLRILLAWSLFSSSGSCQLQFYVEPCSRWISALRKQISTSQISWTPFFFFFVSIAIEKVWRLSKMVLGLGFLIEKQMLRVYLYTSSKGFKLITTTYNFEGQSGTLEKLQTLHISQHCAWFQEVVRYNWSFIDRKTRLLCCDAAYAS